MIKKLIMFTHEWLIQLCMRIHAYCCNILNLSLELLQSQHQFNLCFPSVIFATDGPRAMIPCTSRPKPPLCPEISQCLEHRWNMRPCALLSFLSRVPNLYSIPLIYEESPISNTGSSTIERHFPSNSN